MKKHLLLKSLLVVVLCSVSFGADVISEPFIGVTRIHRTLTSPRALNINVLIIDLDEPTISFKATPSNGVASGETSGQTVAQFVLQENAQIGINCGFFFWNSTIGGYDIMGYAASLGDTYSYFTSWDGWPQPLTSLNLSSTNQVEMISPVPSFPIGQYVAPFGTEVYNAMPGSEWVVKDGVVDVVASWQHSAELHPRTAAGYTQDKSQLILMTVDGRQSGFSLGMTITEVAHQLVDFDVYQGINFDGGGSTAMYFGDPYYENVNVPIDGGVPGQQRTTANNLAVFAQVNTAPPAKRILNDFENANEGTFAFSPGYSGSTQGISTSISTADPVTDIFWKGQSSEKIFIKDDATTTNVSENPTGGWFIRWVSGATASPSQNIPRTTQGYVGFWAKTEAENVSISMCIDNDGGMERGIPIIMEADGFWHCYQWNIEDDSQWQGWINGDGAITGSSWTIDSIQIFGPDADVELFIDDISHDPSGSLDVLESCDDVWNTGQGMLPDLDQNCVVDYFDLYLLAEYWLSSSEYDIFDGQVLDTIDFEDFAFFAASWMKDNAPAMP